MDFKRKEPLFNSGNQSRSPVGQKLPQESKQSDAQPEPEQVDANFIPAPEPVAPTPKPISTNMQPTPAINPQNQVADTNIKTSSIKTLKTKFKKDKSKTDINFVSRKLFIITTIVLTLLLIISIVIQQLAIAELKNERESLAEQVRQVNPIQAGPSGGPKIDSQ